MSEEYPFKDFGQRVRVLREDKGWSQEELARRMMVAQQSIGNWETGRNKPRRNTLAFLANVLETTIEHLEDGAEPRPPSVHQRIAGRQEQKRAAFEAALAAIPPELQSFVNKEVPLLTRRRAILDYCSPNLMVELIFPTIPHYGNLAGVAWGLLAAARELKHPHAALLIITADIEQDERRYDGIIRRFAQEAKMLGLEVQTVASPEEATRWIVQNDTRPGRYIPDDFDDGDDLSGFKFE